MICDGSAMQRVPGSLRYLSKICREADIPIYVLNDPRKWGCQTHATLSNAILDMKKTVSDQIVSSLLCSLIRARARFRSYRTYMLNANARHFIFQIRNALDLREGTAFERGRLVGRIEKEIAWQAHDAARKTRESLVDARRRLMSAKVADWSELTEDDLLRKLIERKVITTTQHDSQSQQMPGRSSLKCSEGLTGICRRCLEAESDGYPTADRSK